MEKGKLIGQGRTSEVFIWKEKNILKLFRKGMPNYAIENEFISSRITFDNEQLHKQVISN